MRRSNLYLSLAVVLMATGVALAWGARGHRTITALALDALPADMPEFLRDPEQRAVIIEQANEPDRYRGTQSVVLGHENNPEHYIDVEQLEQFGLTLESIPPLRYDYLRALAIAKHVHPESVDPYDRRQNADGSQEWPGFLPFAIMEHHAKLRSAFNTLRVLRAIDDPARSSQVGVAKLNIAYHMGMLSHFVADGAQPLHTTVHHHGWVGANPGGYTADKGIHAYIDSGVVDRHGITYDSLHATVVTPAELKADPWEDVLGYIRRSHDLVEPLYRMQKDGTLNGAEGKALIETRFRDAAAMLAGLYVSAWKASEPSDRDIASFVKYNALKTPEPAPEPR